MPFEQMPNLGSDGPIFAKLAVHHCRMAHPKTVSILRTAVFPTIRDQKRRGEIDCKNSLLLDDNVTARWALLWAHGFHQTHHPKGWTFAHIWARPKDPEAYTHLANLAMMPEALGSLSDKAGPLCDYLRFHSQTVYKWRPRDVEVLEKPVGYDDISWRYFDPISDPVGFIRDRVINLNNQRVVALRQLMELE